MIKHRTTLYIISGLLVLAGIGALVWPGIPLGIEFRGGALMELAFEPNEEGSRDIPSRSEVEEVFRATDTGAVEVKQAGDDSLILRFDEVSEQRHQDVLAGLREITSSEIREERFESIGPVIGEETVERSLKAIAFVLVVVVAYVAWAFRKVSYPFGSIRYGLVALAALFHDIIITLGAAALFLYFTGGQIGVPFVAALLTILGYSVNDTIVVLDRVRENVIKTGDKGNFSDVVDRSVRESTIRSINTSLTTLFVLTAIFFFGGVTIQNFIFALIIGIAVGTYSSLFIAAPLLVTWAGRIRSS